MPASANAPSPKLMIDLHTHTDRSDGTASPAQLIGEAMGLGLEALAISSTTIRWMATIPPCPWRPRPDLN